MLIGNESGSIARMPQALIPHPDFPHTAVTGVTVTATRPAPGTLHVHYAVTGDIAGIVLPHPGTPERRDELWRSTCFEAFIRAGDGPAYYEINIAPSYAWAAYHLQSYRSDLVNAAVDAPQVSTQRTAGTYTMDATITGLPAQTDWHLNIPVVIEETNGQKSFWARAHNPGKPDFHHEHVFLFELKAKP